jgi:ATP/maltotriose-dependent transcriptional regulator MalT
VGLDQRSAAAVLGECAPDAAPAVRARLLAEARGNPLALVELPAGLTDAQLAGAAPLPAAIPLTPRLQALFRERVERLPQPTQTALLIAAAEDTGEISIVMRACGVLELGADALDPAERVDLIRTAGGVISFRHPLVRSALYDGAPVSRRQRAHAALASALTGEEHADRRVWHQAMATLTADEEVAAALEASARRAQVRAAHASAVVAFLRAAELSSDEQRRAKRIAAAAQAAWDAGRPDEARAAIARVLADSRGELRAQLLYLRGVIEAHCGDVQTALQLLLDCAQATADPSLRLEALGEAAEATSFVGDYEQAVELGRHAALVSPVTERDEFLVALLTTLAAVAVGDHDRASRALSEVVSGADAIDDARGLIWMASAVWAAPELADALDYAHRAVELARAQGLVSLLPLALQYQATAHLARSHFDEALATAEEGYQLALDTGQTWGASWHVATMAWVETIRGRIDVARTQAERVLAPGRGRDAQFLIAVAEWRLGHMCLLEGQIEEATDHLLAATSTDTPESHPMVALRVTPDLVEAAVLAGRQAEIGERFERYRTWVTQWPTPVHTALYSRSRALLEPAAAGECFDDALSRPGALPAYWRARTELLYGEWLRRDRRRQAARRHLRAALHLFRQLGAVPWEQRAEAELRATGETARKRDPSTLDQLTAQELQIAGLVAGGLTNREVAGQLFLSPRTVDYHLRKVFSKLGIASRTDLVRDGLPQREAA